MLARLIDDENQKGGWKRCGHGPRPGGMTVRILHFAVCAVQLTPTRRDCERGRGGEEESARVKTYSCSKCEDRPTCR